MWDVKKCMVDRFFFLVPLLGIKITQKLPTKGSSLKVEGSGQTEKERRKAEIIK